MIDVHHRRAADHRLRARRRRGILLLRHQPGLSRTSAIQEAHDLVVQAWTRPGPFAFEGKHYHFEYVNVWPRPVPAAASADLVPVAWAASRPSNGPRIPTANTSICRPTARSRRWRAISTSTARRAQTPLRLRGGAPTSIGWSAPIYVAETDEQARRARRAPHIEALFNVFLPMPSELMFFPPGYLSPQSLKNVRSPQAPGTAAASRSSR